MEMFVEYMGILKTWIETKDYTTVDEVYTDYKLDFKLDSNLDYKLD